MFYIVQAALLTKNLSYSSHKSTIAAFGEHFIKTKIFPKDMSKTLARAFEKRQLGDYASQFIISESEAKELLKDGKDFVKIVAEHLKA